jgi:hypothetical protein
MRFPRARWRPTLFSIVLLGATTAFAASPEETQFLAENKAAMAEMMAAMDIKPSGDVDADFVAMMIPHHQGAIDMAKAELRYGHNEQLRRMAQEIIVTQQQEIATMRQALGQTARPSALPSDEGSSSSDEIDEQVTPRGMRMLQEP